MTFLCVVCAKTVRGRQLLVGVTMGRERRSADAFLLHLAYDCYGSVSSRKEGGAAPWGRQLVQDYVLCTAPPLTFMALPFGGCGCAVAPFFPPHSSSFFSLAICHTARIRDFFDSACQKAIKSCAGIKLFTWKIASKTPNCAQQTMQGGKTRLPPPPSLLLLFKCSFNELNV